MTRCHSYDHGSHSLTVSCDKWYIRFACAIVQQIAHSRGAQKIICAGPHNVRAAAATGLETTRISDPGAITPPLTSSRIASSTFSGSSTTDSFGTTSTYPLNAVGLLGTNTVTISCPVASASAR